MPEPLANSQHSTPVIKIGPAGWSYKDWEGIVYPPKLKRNQHPVEYLAGYFDTIEINSSFYGHIKPAIATLWCRKARGTNPDFVFTAKLHKSFTHSPIATVESTSAATIRPTEQDEHLAKEGLDVLADLKMLGALLVQFPVSFRNTNENRDYLEGLIARFHRYPIVVEVRHSSWSNENILRYFTEKGVAFCNIDQPVIGKSLAPTEHVTAPLAYVRLHGRNYKEWFSEGDFGRSTERRDARYDYLYTEAELRDWKVNIERIASRSKVTFVVNNNHFEGKAVVNGLQLKSMIAGTPVRVPESLLKQYPELRSVATAEPGQQAFPMVS
jgi:uncharacterized protein YecE (DUF72 family)